MSCDNCAHITVSFVELPKGAEYVLCSDCKRVLWSKFDGVTPDMLIVDWLWAHGYVKEEDRVVAT